MDPCNGEESSRYDDPMPRPKDFKILFSDELGRTQMKVLYVMKLVILCLSIMCAPLLMSAQGQSSTTALGPVDTYFVTQTSLGTPFQVDSGNLAATKGTTQAIRAYAQLMVSSHIAVNNALDAILKKKPTVPPPTLLKAAYSTMISTLEHQGGKTFDSDYITGQVNYQNANAALYKYEIVNGADPDLKDFAEQTLPKIEDHLQRALNLQGGAQ
jgi:putative membrane protein